MPTRFDRRRQIQMLCRLLALGSSLGVGVGPPNTPAQDATGVRIPAADPVCGFIAGPHFYYEAAQVKQGLSVELMANEAQLGRPVTLRFLVKQKPRNVPVDKLQIEHEQFMHVIGARDDLGNFMHLHPARVSPGVWEVIYTFTQGGNYKFWSDVKYHGTLYSFAHPLLTVSGNYGGESPAMDAKRSVVCSGYEVAFEHSGCRAGGVTNQLQFAIRDNSGHPTELENFLGAPMHLVLLKDDLSVYLHGHPEALRPNDSSLRFKQTFPSPGAYKLFAQFRPKAAKLAFGEAILVEFWLKVDGGSS